MQFLLTADELDELKSANAKAEAEAAAVLQDLCTKVADHMPVIVPWAKDDPPKPWGCVLTVNGEHYCDHCPVQEQCPNKFKEWSK